MESTKEIITVQNGENFVFPKVSIMDNGELKFEIEKEKTIIENTNNNKSKKNCIKYITTCIST
jgi:hypothetical protein